jgi:chorismate mutase/prephenate dehydratase
MAKAKPAATKSGKNSANDLHERLLQIDREIVQALDKRANLLLQSAEIIRQDPKLLVEIDAEPRARAEELIGEVNALSGVQLTCVLKEVLGVSRTLVRPARVAYLGPMYSYSHLAAIARFGSATDLMAVSSISAVFEELGRGQAQYGVVPLENSTDGRITDTLSMFAKRPARICGEIQLAVHHHLLGKGSRSDILEVYSKPQALSQCREWLARHLPTARIHETASTTVAAQLAATKHGAAAIASMEAAQNYGLEVLASNVEDNPNNITRFAVLGEERRKRTGRDKTALMYELPHRSGSLADSLTIFKKSGLNLTWIESFPMPGTKQEYLFFVEFEGHESETAAQAAIVKLRKSAVRLEVLGSYARSEPIG